MATNKNSIKNFEEWNEYFARKYNIDYYTKSNFIIRFIEKKRIKEVIKLLNPQPTDNIIDLGCGGGHILEKIPQGNLTGIDLLESMLKRAKEKAQKIGKHFTLIKGNVEDLPQEIKDQKFDKIIASEILEHVQNPDRLIDEILKIAHPKSVVVISIPNEKFINKLKQIFIKLKIFSILFPNISKKMDEEWHLHSFDLDLLKKITQGKLKLVKIKPIPFWFLPIRYVAKCQPLLAKIHWQKVMENIVWDDAYKLEKTHWWFRNRRKIVFDLIKKFCGPNQGKKILDVGCGTGLLLKELEKFGEVHGLDCAQEAIDYCKKRGLAESVKKGNILDIPFDDEQFDIVTALDILEHLEDESRALKEINRILKKNGIAIIFVPAFQFLWAVQDEASHHFRRYRLGELVNKIEQANLKILKASYFNTFLLPAVALTRLFIRIFKIKIEAESQIHSKVLNPLLHRIFWFESELLKYMNFPFGVSILFVVKRI